MTDLPSPSRFASYPGDHSDAVGKIAGPDTTGTLVTVVSAEHDPEADATRLGFAYGIHVAAGDVKVGQVADVSIEATR